MPGGGGYYVLMNKLLYFLTPISILGLFLVYSTFLRAENDNSLEPTQSIVQNNFDVSDLQDKYNQLQDQFNQLSDHVASLSTSTTIIREVGIPGPIGPAGPQGPQGEKGERGESGSSDTYPQVSAPTPFFIPNDTSLFATYDKDSGILNIKVNGREASVNLSSNNSIFDTILTMLAIQSSVNAWSIDEAGKITATKLCLTDEEKEVCINANALMTVPQAVTTYFNEEDNDDEEEVVDSYITISQDPDFSSVNTIGGSSNVAISQFKMVAHGGDARLFKLDVLPILAEVSPTADGLANVGLYINDAQYSNTINWNGVDNLSFNNLNYYIVSDQEAILTIKADIKTQDGINYAAGTVGANLVAGSNNALGIPSSQFISTSAVSGQSLEMSPPSDISLEVADGFEGQLVYSNVGSQKIGSFTVVSPDYEPFRVTSLKVDLSVDGIDLNDIKNLHILQSGSIAGNVYANVATSNPFSTNIIIPESTSRVFDIYADIVGNINDGSELTTSLTVTGYTIISGTTISKSENGSSVVVTAP